MFDDNHIDKDALRLRSILESGQEEVPAHIWEGVAKGIDKAAARRSRILWLKRSAAGAVAAAAVAAAIVLNHKDPADGPIPATSDDMIAVVPAPTEDIATPQMHLLADLTGHKSAVKPEIFSGPLSSETVSEDSGTLQSETPDKPQTEQAEQTEQTEQTNQAEPALTDGFVGNGQWEEEKKGRGSRLKTSFTLSGLAGTNSPQNKAGFGPLRSPGILKQPSKTTVEQIGEQITYGIPASFGAGVRLNFTERWSLGMGVNYTLLTSRFKGKYTKVTDGLASVPISADVKNRQHYIGIPINAYYNIVSRDFINFYAYAGGAVEKCVGNKYQVLTTPVISHSETVKGVQLSVNAGIGVEFMFGRYVGLYLDPSLRYYFRGGQPKSIRTAQPLMLGFEMGLRFRL